jgi:hypothetical protein
VLPQEDSYHTWRSLYCRDCGHHFRIPIPCKDRYCPVCAKVRTSKINRRLRALVKRQSIQSPDSVRFLTLTITSNNDLSWMVRTLQHSFRKLRQTKSWKKRVTGGAHVIEITRSDAGWHAHIHALICGEYFPFAKLLDLWKAVSPGQGVYLKRIPDGKAIGYMTKYMTKADDKLLPEDIRSINNSLKGVRLFQPFGAWHGWSREISQIRPPCPHCESTRGYLMDWELHHLEAAFDDEHTYNERGSPGAKCYQLTFIDQNYIDPF